MREGASFRSSPRFIGKGRTMDEHKNSEARIRANNKYNAKMYDRINIAVKKGKKDTIKEHAEAQGESINAFINRAIDNQMEQDKRQQ